jgi:NAD(P)-dependent dehydrogenase (short-subunit alcohol dehydrogenase family)
MLKMGRLDGKVAVVTGGGAGVGRGIAITFGAESAAVVVAGKTLSKCENVAGEIEKVGGQALALECDVTDRSQVEAAIDATVTAFGPPDILVNNAQGGTQSPAPLATVTEERFYDLWRGGLLSTVFGMQAVYPHMKANQGGSIVNLVSLLGIHGDPGFSAYGSTKEAIRGLTRHAAREWASDGIRVNAIAPLAYNQHMIDQRVNPSPYLQQLIEQIPLKYYGDAEEDIGPAVLAMVTDMRYMTGATLSLTGGLCILR